MGSQDEEDSHEGEVGDTGERKNSKQDSVELEQEKDQLKSFQKSFNVRVVWAYGECGVT